MQASPFATKFLHICIAKNHPSAEGTDKNTSPASRDWPEPQRPAWTLTSFASVAVAGWKGMGLGRPEPQAQGLCLPGWRTRAKSAHSSRDAVCGAPPQ